MPKEKVQPSKGTPRMISSDEIRAAIREGRITQDEERRLWQVLAEIAWRLWYERKNQASYE